jgi:hypothetical protein
VAVCLFRDKKTPNLRDETYGAVKTPGHNADISYGDETFRDVTYGDQSFLVLSNRIESYSEYPSPRFESDCVGPPAGSNPMECP